MDFLLQLIIAFVWFYTGWKARGWYIVYTLHNAVAKELIDEHGINIAELDKISTDVIEDVMFLTVEEEANVVLVYSRTENEFVCQGTSIDSAAVSFNERRPKTLGTFKMNNKQMYFFEGKVTYEMPEAK